MGEKAILNCRVPPSLKRLVREQAAEHGLSISSWLRRAIVRALVEGGAGPMAVTEAALGVLTEGKEARENGEERA